MFRDKLALEMAVADFESATPSSRKEQYLKFIKQPTRYYACDFECTTREPYQVYLVTLQNIITDEKHVFYDLDGLFDYLEGDYRSVLWFHNGRNYDFEFIIPYAYQHKLQYTHERYPHLKIPQPMVEIDGRNGKLKYTDKGDTIRVFSSINLVDSRDVLSASIATLGKTLNLLKGMGDVETPLIAYINGDNDWAIANADDSITPRTDSFKQALIDNRWTEYAIRDTEILAKAVKTFKLYDSYKSGRKTASSIAFQAMIDRSPKYKIYRETLIESDKALPKEVRKEMKEIRKVFNRVAKTGYKGGIAWTNPLWANKLLKSGDGRLHYSYDYVSMYPSIYMNPTKYPLPQAMPLTKQAYDAIEDKSKLLTIIEFKYLDCEIKLKNEQFNIPQYFPILKQRTDVDVDGDEDMSKAYNYHFKGPITITGPEWEYVKEAYTINKAEGPKVYYYLPHEDLHDALVRHGEYYFDIKSKYSGDPDHQADVLYAKLQLNGCYGYLAFFERPTELYNYIYHEDTNTIDKVKTGNGAPTGLTFAEVPAAAFITAYGRLKLANDMNQLGLEHVVCTDTDSLYIYGLTEETIESKVDVGSNLGQLKKENSFSQIISIKPKTYCIADVDGNVIKSATAGIAHKFKHIDEFKLGSEIRVLEKQRGSGGVGLVPKIKHLGSLEIIGESGELHPQLS